MPIVKWRKFEYVVIGVNSDNSEKKKLQLVDKLTPPGEMFLHFKNLLQRYPSHQFQANWQNQQLRELVENLPLGHVIAVHDYSENYMCSMQDQIQSLYFSQVQASMYHHFAPPRPTRYRWNRKHERKSFCHYQTQFCDLV